MMFYINFKTPPFPNKHIKQIDLITPIIFCSLHGQMAAAIEQKYQKKDLRTHILTRPGVYVGSIEPETAITFVIDKDGIEAVEREVTYVPGLAKIFDEVVSNARDHFIRLRQLAASDPNADVHHVRNIDVAVDQATGVISVRNDGDGLDVEVHPQYKVFVPELVFANLLTSVNYDDNEEREVAGTNGLGVKLTNVFSTEFSVETLDAHRGKLYTQTVHNNMTVIDKPKIKAAPAKKYPFTSITFHPDYPRFKLEGLTDDVFQLFRKRTYDLAASLNGNVAVSFNGDRLPIKSFQQYADLFLGPKGDHDRAYFTTPDGRWEIVASYNESDGGMRQVSFVNGSVTSRGGTHVNYIANQIVNKLVASVKKRAIKPQIVRDNMFLFVNATIINPSFDSQTKETLTTPQAKFGSECTLPDDFIKKVAKTGLLDRVLEFAELLDNKKLAKTDGKKKNRISVPKLDDANRAGTKDSQSCTLILTEGDSAKTMAISGLTKEMRDIYGVFPLRGKLLNVRDTAAAKIQGNAEITALKQILGLRSGVDYGKEGLGSLRYGHVMLLTDQDHDGSHIKGLLMNAFDAMFKSLLKIDGFLVSMLTPIVKVSRSGGAGKPPEVHSFYTLSDYEQWTKAHRADKGPPWTHKYYKGLGTSTSVEAKQYFENMRLTRYTYTGKASDDALDLAFNSKRANDRKDWLKLYDPEVTLDYSAKDVTYVDFVNKDLIHFSNRDLERSIPSVVDGLKESIRKILYACIKRKLWSAEIKVAQLSGYVSEHAAYHHGEASLQEAIVGMAQTFVGSGNNINLLEPNGQFGTRIQGGKDHSAPRYIFTLLTPIARKVFRAEDSPVLDYLEDDGDPCEPTYYVPVIPYVLCNGAQGIGTGFSTTVPCHDPRALVEQCLGIVDALGAGFRIESEEDLAEDAPAAEVVAKHRFPPKSIEPWFAGFTGQIAAGKSFGRYRRLDTKGGVARVEIVELPIGTWTDDYKAMLEDPEWAGNKKNLVKDFETYQTDTTVNFVLRLTPDGDAVAADPEKFVDMFKLASAKGLGTANMHLYSAERRIAKYETTAAIFKAFAHVRLLTYVKRKKHDIKALTQELRILDARARFIADVCDGEIKVMNTPARDVAAALRGAKPPYPTQREEETGEPAADGEEEASADEASGGAKKLRAAPRERADGGVEASAADAAVVAADAAVKDYAYLLTMPISSLTRERKLKLEIESAALRKRLEDLKKTTIPEMWRKELLELRDAL